MVYLGGAMLSGDKSRKIILSILLIVITMLISGISMAQDENGNGDDDEDELLISNQVNDEEEAEKKIPKTKSNVKGIVVDLLTGKAVSGATVSLLSESVKTGDDGKFIINSVNDYHLIQITARITTDLDIVIGCSYFFVQTNYYPISANIDGKTDIKIIDMTALGDDVVLKVGDYSKENIDMYCEKCHEGSPCLLEEEYGLASNGKVKLRGLLVRQSELEEYVKQMKKKVIDIDRYASIRYSDSHPKRTDISDSVSFDEGRVVIPEDMALYDDKIVICDTCHTRHIPTEWSQFMVMDFMQQESICVKCHK